MCNHANREAAMTVLDPKTWCDPCLTPLIKALNDGGIRTTSSCCGHDHRPGWVSLDDGRWLMIAPDDEWMDWLSSRIFERVGDMPGHEPIYVPTTHEETQPQGTERVEWGALGPDGDVISGTWTGREAVERWIDRYPERSCYLPVRRTVTEFAPIVGDWEPVEETQP